MGYSLEDVKNRKLDGLVEKWRKWYGKSCQGDWCRSADFERYYKRAFKAWTRPQG